MDFLSIALHGAAVLTIMFAWYKITALRRRIPGGIVKATCNIVSQFIGLFALACMTLSFSSLLPEGAREMLIVLVLIFAAAFSILVINFLNEFATDSGF